MFGEVERLERKRSCFFQVIFLTFGLRGNHHKHESG
jgi:hypothetical protein